jgi:hypothetical protein
MLAAWTEALPLFVVRWLARRMCERLHTTTTTHGYVVLVTARPDVLIRMPSDQP